MNETLSSLFSPMGERILFLGFIEVEDVKFTIVT